MSADKTNSGGRLTVAGLVVVICTVLLAGAGCAPQLDRIEAGVQNNHDEIASLRAENRRLQGDVTVLAELLRLEQAIGDESNAARVERYSQLSNYIAQLIGRLDDNMAYMRDLSARVDLLATRSGVATLGAFNMATGDADEALDALPEEGRSIYQAAQLDRNRGNTAMAREGYEEFLEKYGNNELADDALYWLGVLDYDEKQYDAALGRFDDLLLRFPQSQWVPSALMKSANSQRQLGHEAAATATLQELLDSYPDSDEALLAREQQEGR